MLLLQIAILLMVALTGTAVVLTRNPASQAIGLSFYGLVMALMFFIYQAPDVALSQIVVGAVALPLMILLTLAKVRLNTQIAELQDKQKSEQQTTDEGRSEHRIPPEMFAPAAVLAILALAIGLAPGVRQAAQAAATRMADAAGYQAIVLDHAPVPVNPAPVEHVFPMSSMVRAIAATVLALALAGFSLSPYWPRKKSILNPLKAFIVGLRELHSGHVGDYVALLTFGVAALGVALSVLIKLGF